MIKLLGIFLMLISTICTILYLNQQKNRRLDTLSEMMEFLRNLTCDVTDWKLPLEEAVIRRTKHTPHLKKLREAFLLNKDQIGIRKALLFAIENEHFIEHIPKQLILRYIAELGREKRESTEELYRRVQTQLEQYYQEKKEENKTYRQLTVGTVGGFSAAVIILLL